MLSAKGLKKSYGERVILDRVDLRLERGECLGILGPNGSGKSTLVKLITGEERPDQGGIWLAEKELSAYSPKERAKKMAVLSQESIGPVPYSVEDVVKMGRHPYQGSWPWLRPADNKIVQDVMKETDVFPLRDRFVSQLSGGERQRVAIAKAMAQEPELLVLDEPTTYLDIQYQLAILDLLKSWQERKQLAILIVLHDLNLAAQYCDRLLLLKEGRTVKAGKPEEVIQPAWIEEVYGVKPLVIYHPQLQVPQVFLQSNRKNSLTLHHYHG
ncbi:heme ABC transporter ATP-binding protein [Paenactinomyces guangxiensis]|uniref:Heme ABC transporter ATP-binding protein n=1 Tax=Paenactinomyces guangxiensis TaxID=1490290 RepID=A0A7W1WRV7_9BACL|nr:heme ABC transporter ATP-binding protein [Paenactinomyces guangxiensis]MBA4494818.1 heme ABC transporter ATP-binding protein [Paenactinomyces guangxiensis]MBH8591901.1 heme ABC transporter ATP-binding protein [Paenactinomyces guangxiensis]